MTKLFLEQLLEKLKLQLLVLRLQLQVKFLRQKLTIPNLPQPKIVIVHHGGGDWDFKTINRNHRWWKQRNGSVIEGKKSSLGYWAGYHKFIEFTGKLYIARRDNEEGAHCVDPARPGYWNKNAVGLGVQGNTDLQKSPDWLLMTLKDELDEYVAKGFKVKYHGQIVPTACPGKYLKEWLKDNGYIR